MRRLFVVCLVAACRYDDAVKILIRNLGDDVTQWKWGEMVKVRFPHPLAGAPLIGSQFTITPFLQNGTDSTLLGGTINLGSKVSMRLIADPGDWDKTQQGITPGESGLPKSPHWTDQLADWRAVTPREFPFTAAAVSRLTKETLALEPTP